MSPATEGTDTHIVKLEPVAPEGDFVEPGVYLCLLPTEGEHDNGQHVIGILAVNSTSRATVLRVMAGMEPQGVEGSGVFFRQFEDFKDMADTLNQGLTALDGGSDDGE